MRENNLFSDKQFGFITGRSTVLQMLAVLDIWTKILDQGGELDVIYCDFMKAFAKVPHKILLLKIKKTMASLVTFWAGLKISWREEHSK